jgi:hypothetical protein
MASLQSFLAEAKDMAKPKVYMDNNGQYRKYSLAPKKKKNMANMSSSMFFMSDFGVPLWQRWAIEAKEGAKTIGGVVKDIATKKAYTDPRKNKMWTEDLGRGYAEARNRVKQSLRKANDANIEKELMKNRALDLQVDKMRQAAKKKYAAGGLRDLAPLTRSENDGVLALDKRYGVGKKAKK